MLKAAALLALFLPSLPAQTSVSSLTPAEKEAFLLKAEVKLVHTAKKGITGTLRATLSDGTITHDASIQKVDQEAFRFETNRGTEMFFRDCYKFNIAAWRLAQLLGIERMVPPSVARRFRGSEASFTWWVDDVQLDESERMKRKIQAPDKEVWNREYLIMKVFDQLIYNTDRNAQNILYDKEWHIWMIDHSRAFRIQDTLLEPKAMTQCDLRLFNAMKGLNEAMLQRELGGWLRNTEIKSLLTRRDRIVALFEKQPSRFYQYLAGPVTAPR